MTVATRRTCATCCSFTTGECLNFVTFILPGGVRQDPTADDVCHDHQTEEEDGRDRAAIALFRKRIGLEGKKEGRKP